MNKENATKSFISLVIAIPLTLVTPAAHPTVPNPTPSSPSFKPSVTLATGLEANQVSALVSPKPRKLRQPRAAIPDRSVTREKPKRARGQPHTPPYVCEPTPRTEKLISHAGLPGSSLSTEPRPPELPVSYQAPHPLSRQAGGGSGAWRRCGDHEAVGPSA